MGINFLKRSSMPPPSRSNPRLRWACEMVWMLVDIVGTMRNEVEIANPTRYGKPSFIIPRTSSSLRVVLSRFNPLMIIKSMSIVRAMLYNKDSLLYGYSIVYLRGIKEKLLEKLTTDELLARYSERREDNPYTKAYTKLEAKDLFSKYFKDCSAEVRYNVIDLPEQRKVKVNVPDEYELGWHVIAKGIK